MGVSIKADGINEIRDELNKLGDKAEDIIDLALLEAVKPIHKEMQKRVKVSRLNKEHLKDNIPINKEKKDGSIHSVSIGFDKKDNSKYFYAKYLEWGTSKMKARPFMQSAIDKKGKEAEKILIDTISKELEL